MSSCPWGVLLGWACLIRAAGVVQGSGTPASVAGDVENPVAESVPSASVVASCLAGSSWLLADFESDFAFELPVAG